ncbi:MAG: hypothetical protein IPH43_14360 [Xanthomonadales bacterium]|nr:hypothetical protein [Xanthomonadales bacterium]
MLNERADHLKRMLALDLMSKKAALPTHLRIDQQPCLWRRAPAAAGNAESTTSMRRRSQPKACIDADEIWHWCEGGADRDA